MTGQLGFPFSVLTAESLHSSKCGSVDSDADLCGRKSELFQNQFRIAAVVAEEGAACSGAHLHLFLHSLIISCCLISDAALSGTRIPTPYPTCSRSSPGICPLSLTSCRTRVLNKYSVPSPFLSNSFVKCLLRAYFMPASHYTKS